MQYKCQKQKVQIIIKQAITVMEKKITDEIRTNKNKSRAMWENIAKLRKAETSRMEEIQLYDEEGNQLDKGKEREELVNFWTAIYQQHANEVDKEWNEEEQQRYAKDLTEASREFPRLLREHMDMTMFLEPILMVEGNGEARNNGTASYRKCKKNEK